jgi:tRNA A-37 threonylcarbamoyl transferase component Bud32
MAAASVAVKAGDTLEGRYKIIKTVGEGGMGTVYLAEHMLIQRRVAIKILRPELAMDATVVERFMKEARAAGAIGHPHIVESTDMGFTRDEVPFIVFEYLEGSLLSDEIYRVRGMPPRRALRIATQIASALHAAHNAGIVHRDLKSDNIFLTDKEDKGDHVKVLDFGISRFLEADSSGDDSRHLVMGTPEFMAPEQILTPEKVDKRADIYALGVVLYEMLTARRPFDFDEPDKTGERRLTDTDKLLHKIVTEPVPSTNRRDLPPGLEELIRDKLLAKDPENRFQSMTEVVAACEAFFNVARRDSEPIAVQTATPTPAGQQVAATSPSTAKRASGVGWLLGAVLLGATGGALMFVENKQPATSSTSAAATQALSDAAARLAATLDTQSQAARMRAEGIASLPMLRAAIVTDAATLRDMVRDRDVLFKPEPNEVLEIFQMRDAKPTTMLRIPEAAQPLEPVAEAAYRLASDGAQLHLVVGAAVSDQQGASNGAIALSQPVDLAALKAAIASHTKQAALVGLDKPVVLAGTGAPPDATTFPIQKTKLALAAALATTAHPAAKPALKYARFACWGLAVVLLAMFGVSRSRKLSAS